MYYFENKQYYFNGEDRRQTYKKWGERTYKYEFRSEYYHGIGNTLYAFGHTLMNRKMKAKGYTETWFIYENKNLIKKFTITY